MTSYLESLRLHLHCQTLRDICFNFYNELNNDMWKQIEVQKKLNKINTLNNKKFDSYLDYEETKLRKSKKHKK